MSEAIEIDEKHWRGLPRDWDVRACAADKDSWEWQLRRAIARQPDPVQRFTEWLASREGDGHTTPRLTLIEQPYLGWAETVDRILEQKEAALRQSIARSITHPDED